MTLPDEASLTEPKTTIRDMLPRLEREEMVREIVAGLTARPKYVSSMFFYDETGSKLFEEITRLPEYYLTRTEKGVLEETARRMRSDLTELDIIELGSGDCSKISILLSAVDPEAGSTVRYIPIDISRAAIEESISILSDRFSRLEIHGVVDDFTTRLLLPPGERRRLFCFFGSTIGNFTREESVGILSRIAARMGEEDSLLLGLDMVKERGVLERAYNDSRGVTAAFNRNILDVVNGIAETDFEPERLEHLAFYNRELSRIEMHLEAGKTMKISSPRLSEPIRLERGETIHTENSHKFTGPQVERLAEAAGFRIDEWFTDERKWFSVVRLRTNGEVGDARH